MESTGSSNPARLYIWGKTSSHLNGFGRLECSLPCNVFTFSDCVASTIKPSRKMSLQALILSLERQHWEQRCFFFFSLNFQKGRKKMAHLALRRFWSLLYCAEQILQHHLQKGFDAATSTVLSWSRPTSHTSPAPALAPVSQSVWGLSVVPALVWPATQLAAHKPWNLILHTVTSQSSLRSCCLSARKD